MLLDLRIALRVAAGMLVLAAVLALSGIAPGPIEKFLDIARSGHVVFNAGSLTLQAFLLLAAGSFPRWRIALAAALAGAALDLWLLGFVGTAPPGSVVIYWVGVLSAGPGLVSLGILAAWFALAPGGDRVRPGLLLGGFVLLVIYSFSLDSYLQLTAALHPATYDQAAYRIDGSLGFSPSVTVALLARTIPGLEQALSAAYHLLPYGFGVFYGLQVISGRRWPASVLMITTVSGAIAMALYQFCPIAGPAYAFGADFPLRMQPPERYLLEASGVAAAPRNAMPSMHFAWALLLWFNARGHSAPARTASALLLGLIFLATLGLGEHYLIDLVAGVPAALAMQALCSRTLPWSDPARRGAIVTGTALTVAWIVAVRAAAAAFSAVPGLTWIALIATLTLSALHFRRLGRHSAPGGAAPEAKLAADPAPGSTLQVRAAVAMFVISGFAGLVYQVLFAKSLALTFGSTSTATYTVLATYMGGMALGAWFGGLIAQRREQPLRLYGLCELGIGLFCLLTPFIFAAIQQLYVAVAAGIPPDAPVLTALRVVLGSLTLALPTILMGMTLPLLARFVGERAGSLGVSVAMLYGANTLGAAFGALLTGYVIIPALGILGTTLIAAAANLGVALLALRLQQRWSADAPAAAMAPVDRVAAPGSTDARERVLGRVAIGLLSVGGFVTLALEVNYIHLLAVVAGNSVYAFALMLFAFLLGLGAGAEIARRLLATALALTMLLAWLEFGLAGAILGGVFMWESLPAYFASFDGYPLAQGFGAREFIRGIVCWLAMFPVALFIGALYPVAMECVGRAFPARRFEALGRAAALNTAGNILGVLAAGFILLPALGALRTVQLLAVLSLALGIAALAVSPLRRRPLAWTPALVVAALLAAQPSSFDYTALASGANVYFRPQGFGTVIDHAESVDGGLTTVAESRTEGGSSLTLLTNGKFQGSNAVHGEMPAQVGFAVAPLLHTGARENALVIGYGTGVSARTLHDAGFGAVDIVDLSADIVRLADRHFGDVNQGVTGRPGVRTYITDGRNFLMLQERSYDVISMEISSIWFAGAASLYNREFYQLVKRRLRAGGVLQQWMQLHHIAPIDMLYILGSVRAEFRYVWLYFIGDQGIIVASNDASRSPARANFAQLRTTPSFGALMEILQGYSEDLFDTLLLNPQGTDALLASFGPPPAFWVSTDDNLFLEYHTPKGGVLDTRESYRRNLGILRKFAPER